MPPADSNEDLVGEILNYFWRATPPSVRERLFTPLIESPGGFPEGWRNPVNDGQPGAGPGVAGASPKMPNTRTPKAGKSRIPNPPGWTNKIPWTPPPDDPTPLPVPRGHGLSPDRNRMPEAGSLNDRADPSDDQWWWEKQGSVDGVTPAAQRTGDDDLMGVLARAVHAQLTGKTKGTR